MRNIEKISKNKNFISSELELQQKLWASKAFIQKKIKKGHLLSSKDIKFLRPGNGIPVSDLKKVIGKKIKKKFKK